jgi:hypothetical protein
MKTLADFKRAAILGSVWDITHPSINKTTRKTVVHVQSNAICFHEKPETCTGNPSKDGASWFYLEGKYVQARFWKIEGDRAALMQCDTMTDNASDTTKIIFNLVA